MTLPDSEQRAGSHGRGAAAPALLSPEQEPGKVDVGPCRCPSTPHEVDTVWLKPELDVPLAIAANAAIRPILQMFTAGEITQAEANADVESALSGVYLRHAIESWTFIDQRGLPIPIRPSNTKRLLPYGNGGELVVNTASDLYQERLLAPFIEAEQALEKELEKAQKQRMASLNREQRRAMQKSSRNGAKAPSTSVGPNTGSTRPEPSASSSPTNSEAGRPSAVLAP